PQLKMLTCAYRLYVSDPQPHISEPGFGIGFAVRRHFIKFTHTFQGQVTGFDKGIYFQTRDHILICQYAVRIFIYPLPEILYPAALYSQPRRHLMPAEPVQEIFTCRQGTEQIKIPYAPGRSLSCAVFIYRNNDARPVVPLSYL